MSVATPDQQIAAGSGASVEQVVGGLAVIGAAFEAVRRKLRGPKPPQVDMQCVVDAINSNGQESRKLQRELHDEIMERVASQTIALEIIKDRLPR